MRSRSRLEIYLELMEAVARVRDPLGIAQKVSLPLSVTRKHLSFLASQGLVDIEATGNGCIEYELTLRGTETLDSLQRLVKDRLPLLKQPAQH